MFIEGRYIDEILRPLYEHLSNSTDTFSAGKGKGHDLLAPKIILKNPRARISATQTRGRLISGLAELCWYLSGSSELEHIRYYLPKYPPDGVKGKLRDAYGPRLIGSGDFGYKADQINRVIAKLKAKPDSRRAVISILESSDLEPSMQEAPCTVALQFIRRRERLHLIAMMRSNDAYLGFSHDLFCFTMIQEIVARALGIRVGEYHHFATSLHLYERDMQHIKRYMNEGFQNPTFAMPKMPSGDQRSELKRFIETEAEIRSGKITEASQVKLSNYWKDLALVLLRYADTKSRRGTEHLENNFANISHDFYRNFFTRKPKTLPRTLKKQSIQENLRLEQKLNEN